MTQTLRCDPWVVVLFRLGFCALIGFGEWHLGSENTPWHPGPNYWQIGIAVAAFGMMVWHSIAYLASRVVVDRTAGHLVLRRLSANGLEEEIYQLSSIAAVVLAPRHGFGAGRGQFRTRRISLRLGSGQVIPVGTLSVVWGLEDHAQDLALAIGCGVDEPPADD